MRLVRYVIVALMLIGLAGVNPAWAQAEANNIRAELVAETRAPKAGARFTLALAMTPAPKWHGYWANTGDAGMETLVDWKMPQGLSAGPLAYPVPSRLLIAGLMNYVFKGPYAHLIEVDVPAGLAPGTRLPIRATADWLACTDTICVPEKAELAIDLIVGDGAVAPEDRARFDAWRAALPRPLEAKGSFEIKAEVLRIALPVPAGVGLDDPYFYPRDPKLLVHAAPQRFSRSGDQLVVEVAAQPGATAQAAEGVLGLGDGTGLAISLAPGAVPAGGEALGDKAGGTDWGLAAIIGAFAAAVLGGLLLNIMPCVFPILSLKALSLAKSGESAVHAKRDALAYSAGVILVCLGLGALLLGLRSGGAALGWAFQLQDPRVILLLLLLVAGIGFNLAGLFELPMLGVGGAPGSGGGMTGAFATGALAAFVATPCTGPFMAAALGAALVLPAAAAMAIFFGLGLGIALPFLALGFVPALRRRLPKPGAWMETMRRILSLPMFATALGLAWILGRQAGVNAMTLGLIATMLIVVGLWWVGLRQRRGLGGAWWPALALLLPAIAIVAWVPRLAVAAERAQAGDSLPFSEAALAELRAQGKPAFVYFTADWCLTCKVNEKAAIDRDEVRAAFKAAGISVMVGDWTRGDPAIGRFLEQHGRSGVPLYLFYPKGGGEPKLLPQVLTPAMLTALAE